VRTLVCRLFLALALVAAQTGGAVHALSHGGERAGQKDAQHAPAKALQCDLCHAFAAADAADAAPGEPPPAFPAATSFFAALPEALVVTLDPPPYAGRAPPSFS
jgi:hypothetical protein